MRMESDKDRCKTDQNGMLTDEPGRKGCAKSLGIQRCYSDGVLTLQNSYAKGKPASKSSSETSINGVQDFEEILTGQAHANGFVTGATCALDNNLSSEHATVKSKRTNGIKKDILSQQIPSKKDACNIVCPRTWSHRAVEKKRANAWTNENRQIQHFEEIAALVNSMELNVEMSESTDRQDYLSNVCNTYRQEADVLYGRTRGGVKNDTNQHMMHSTGNSEGSLENENHMDEILSCDYANNSDTTGFDDICVNNETLPPNYLKIVAPLAMPENLSDEESTACFGSLDNPAQCTRHISSVLHNPDSFTSDINTSADLEDKESKKSICINGNGTFDMSSHPHTISNGAQCECEDTSNYEIPKSKQVIVDDDVSCIEGYDETYSYVQNGIVANESVDYVHVDQILLPQTRPSSSSSFDSIDDIGDFIEADLPPNVERLALFARESSASTTTDEDEGCGDEVLPNANGDIESENETIDPLTHAEQQHNISGERVSDSGIKLLNNTSAELLSYSNDFTMSHYAFKNSQSESSACNIFCNKSTDDNEGVGEFSDSAYSGLFEDGDNVRPETSNLDLYCGYAETSYNKNRTSLLTKGDNCVSCDKPVDTKLQRKDELGVVVCDKCYNERDFEKSRISGNVVRKKIRTLSHSSSASRLAYSRHSNLRSDSQDKVNNANDFSVRLSSSDSDPFDRLYVSDSSEVVSPDAETGLESVFPSSSTSSDGNSVQYNQMNGISNSSDGSQLPGSLGFHGQSFSLEYESPDEVLYCPYYTRRSRSLDQELSANGITYIKKTPDKDTRNISVTSSNFQEDESNNQEKVFEKQPYNLEALIPTYSSSDEEENTRVPAPYINHSNMQEGEEVDGSQSDMNNLLMQSHEYNMNAQNIVVADEPIYEDIEDLELLLQEAGSDGGTDNRSSAEPLCSAISKLRIKKRTRNPVSDVEKVMIWNEYEAYVVQVKQIGTSACGPTAILNVLKAFDFQAATEEVIQKITSTIRMEAAPIPYYLFSRYSAGTTSEALVDGVGAVTRGAIKGRFFHFYPKRNVDIMKWLGQWMKKGAIPVATLNLQRGVKPGWTIPDAWHHQMVYGVSSKGVYLTNPLEIIPESVIMEQLTSDSVLLIRKEDVVSRFRDWCPLNEILKQKDPRWMTMNVLGQIVHMLREQCMPQEQLATMRSQLMSHISIPAVYKAGIILFMRANSEFYNELMQTTELPLTEKTDEA